MVALAKPWEPVSFDTLKVSSTTRSCINKIGTKDNPVYYLNNKFPDFILVRQTLGNVFSWTIVNTILESAAHTVNLPKNKELPSDYFDSILKGITETINTKNPFDTDSTLKVIPQDLPLIDLETLLSIYEEQGNQLSVLGVPEVEQLKQLHPDEVNALWEAQAAYTMALARLQEGKSHIIKAIGLQTRLLDCLEK